jgi:hypothetical protein
MELMQQLQQFIFMIVVQQQDILAHTVTVPADSSTLLCGKDNPIYLEESDQIEAGASATGDLQIIISYEEIDDA